MCALGSCSYCSSVQTSSLHPSTAWLETGTRGARSLGFLLAQRHRLPRLLNWEKQLDPPPASRHWLGWGGLPGEPFRSLSSALSSPGSLRLQRGIPAPSGRDLAQTEQVWLKGRPGQIHYMRATLFCKQGHRGRDPPEGTLLLTAATAASSSFA